MRAFVVRLPSGVRYWTVLDNDCVRTQKRTRFCSTCDWAAMELLEVVQPHFASSRSTSSPIVPREHSGCATPFGSRCTNPAKPPPFLASQARVTMDDAGSRHPDKN